jgi:hypothetical protein
MTFALSVAVLKSGALLNAQFNDFYFAHIGK